MASVSSSAGTYRASSSSKVVGAAGGVEVLVRGWPAVSHGQNVPDDQDRPELYKPSFADKTSCAK